MHRQNLISALIRVFVTIFLSVISNWSSSQSLSGPTVVNSSEEVWYFSDAQLHPYSNVNWHITGGVILYSDRNSCYVRWEQGYGAGEIAFWEDIYGYSMALSVCYGLPQIEPAVQEVQYMATATLLQLPWCDFDNVNSFQWEESDNLINWTPIGNGQVSFMPNASTATKYYRVKVQYLNGTIFYTDPATVLIPELTPGYISSSGNIAYGQTPIATSVPASGGLCTSNNYFYTWEYSNGSGQWVVFGNTESFSSTSLPALTFDMRIRRGVKCGNETKYSNVINLMPVYTSVNWENLHYVREIAILKPGVKSWYEADDFTLAIGNKFQSTKYLDEWGRVIQTNEKLTHTSGQGSKTKRFDLIGVASYDNIVREEKSYLPYPASVSASSAGFYRSSAFSEQNSTLNTAFQESAGSPTWALKSFEKSPLGRVSTIKRPGGVLNASPTYTGSSVFYDYNTVNEVLIWKCNYGDLTTDYPISSAYYAAGTLSKVKAVNEKGAISISYSDNSGNIILQKVQVDASASNNETGTAGWQITYYVYNDFNQLRFIITPKAFELMASQGSYDLTTKAALVNDLCFYYNYDSRGRKYVEHEPGAGINYRLYDIRNRPVLVQTQKLRDMGLWQFILYDELDRQKATGLATYTNPVSGQSDLVSLSNALANLALLNVSINLFTGANENVTVYNPVLGVPQSLPGFSNIVANAVNYYDGYEVDAALFVPNNSFPAANIPNIRPFAASLRIKSFATGQKVRIIDNDGNSSNDQFVRTTQFYDEFGAIIQSNKEVFKENGNITREIISTRLDWMGKVASTVVNYQVPGTVYSNFLMATSYDYDFRHRVLKIYKHFGGNSKTIVEYTYNQYGQIETKKLAPDWHDPINPILVTWQPPNGIENMAYSYNIHGALEAINKSYALQTTTSTDQWKNVFSMVLGYEKNAGVFTKVSNDGSVAGWLWRTQGDNVVRKYEYDYDLMNRMTLANFVQREKPIDFNWSKSIMDYSVTGLSYDIQGNMLTMQQAGVEFGKLGGKLIDNLQYSYQTVSGSANWTNNKLMKVFDNSPAIGSILNGTAGDFKDESWGSNSNDYVYDLSGNLTVDHNKKLRVGSGAGIDYNFLNFSNKLTIEGAGIVEYIYLANGEKIAKKTSPVSPNTGNPNKTTWYFGGLVFEEIVSPNPSGKQLQFIMHEEGRIRVISHVAFAPGFPTYSQDGGVFGLPDGKFGVFDYFVKDHLGNSRFVLTEEKHEQRDFCGMDDINTTVKAYEESQFNFASRAGAIRFQKPASLWTANGDNKVVRLGGPGSDAAAKIGPAVLLKVMSGDQLNMMVNYHFTTVSNTDNNDFYTVLANSLATAFAGVPSGSKFTNINAAQGAAGGPLAMFLQNAPVTQTDKPRAYLNWLFYDENFNYIPYDAGTGLGSSSLQVNMAGDHMSPLTPGSSIRVPKNGYAYVFLSNASENQFVYFDNFQVNHVRGKILEENSYYPYGLRILPISANAMIKPDGKYKYNGIEQIGEFGLQDLDAYYRELDPQIGRWWQHDPKAGMLASRSPYESMGSNPVSNVDPLGDLWGRKKNGTPKWWNKGIGKGYEDVTGRILQIDGKKVFFGSNGEHYDVLKDVIVSGKRKSNWLNWPKSGSGMKGIDAYLSLQLGIRNLRNGGGVADGTNGAAASFINDHASLISRMKQADDDYRMATGVVYGASVALIAAPLAAELGLFNPGLNPMKFGSSAGQLAQFQSWMGAGNALGDAMYQVSTILSDPKGTWSDYNPASTIGNFFFSNPLYSALPGAAYDAIFNGGSFLKLYGKGVAGDFIGNIPMFGKWYQRSVLEGYFIPIAGNALADGLFK